MDMEGSLYTSVLNEQCKSSLWLSSAVILGFQPLGGSTLHPKMSYCGSEECVLL